MSLFLPPDEPSARRWPAPRPLPDLADHGVPRPITGQVQAGDRQVAVLVVSESQLDSLLGRPALRHLNSRLLSARGAAGRWRVAAAAVALVVGGVVLGGWVSAPRPVLGSMLPERVLAWSRPPVAPPLLTGAGFSLALASPRSADAAAASLGRLQDLGLPAYAEPVAGSPAHQVIVGPYASLDEAEQVQRRLSRAGFGGPRLAVDDSLRHTGQNDAAAFRRGETNVLLIGGSGRVSLVLELAAAPRQVVAQQASDTVFDLDIAPVVRGVSAREWSAPPGVHLLEHVSLQEGAGLDGDRSLRARLTIPPSVRATARVEGRRVYVDLGWPEAVTAASRPRTAPPVERAAAPAARAAAPAPAAPGVADLTALRAALGRFQEIAPFLLSVAASPDPAVLGALDGTLAALAETLDAMDVSPEARASHGLLRSAVTSARRAVDPLLLGDRLAQAHQAVGHFEAARAGVAAP